MTRRTLRLALLGVAAATAVAAAATRQQEFDHERHRELFPLCVSCHAGAEDASQPIWPEPASCDACHDGTVEERVEWRPPEASHPDNLDFTHQEHADEVRAGADSALACTACHAEDPSDRMAVRIAVVESCLACHGVTTAHVTAPDTACATCHVPLPEAPELAASRVAAFPVPPSHREPGFAYEGHSELARVPGREQAVAASCATCHARDFCIECHVDAPEQPVIQALAPDPRAREIPAVLAAPPSHERPGFITGHGRDAARGAAECATCHTQESCTACHAEPPPSVRALHAAGPGRAAGATITRRRPASHGADFSDIHGPVAAAEPQSCSTCHTRPQCLDCHRPDPGDANGYHPAGFLTRHPAAAYSRETECADCHNTAGFCTDCHVSSGLMTDGRLVGGFHDAKRFFIAGHGQAARQNLESCVSCHTEQDCLTCHSAIGGRRFNPHGPGFDPERLRGRNSQMCTVCHGAIIPGE